MNVALCLARKLTLLGSVLCLPFCLSACGGGDGDSNALQECLGQVQTAQDQCNANAGTNKQAVVACTTIAVAAIANCNSQHGSN